MEADCAHSVEEVMKAKSKEDFQALQSLLSKDASVKPGQRAKVFYMLGRWGDPAPVSAIREILPRLDETEKVSALDALGRLGTKEALDGILEHTGDSSPQVRKFAARALARIDRPDAQRKLKEIQAKDPVDYVRNLAAKYVK